MSLGALDAGLAEGGSDLLHVLRLVDRRLYLTWGMHYRYTARDGELTAVERLHVNCEVHSNSIDNMRESLARQAGELPRNIKFGANVVMPGFDFPTEAQWLQVVLNRDAFRNGPGGRLNVDFWLDGRVIRVDSRGDRLDERYYAVTNPFLLAD